MDPLENTVELSDLSRRLAGPAGEEYKTAYGIFEFIRKNVKYEGLDRPDGSRRPYRSPSETLKAGAGCCYEQSALAMSLARNAGLGVQAVLVKYDNGMHMMAEVTLPSIKIIIDPTSRNGYAMLLEKTNPVWSKSISDDEVREIANEYSSKIFRADVLEFRGKWGNLSKLALAFLVGLGVYVNYAEYQNRLRLTDPSHHGYLARPSVVSGPEFR